MQKKTICIIDFFQLKLRSNLHSPDSPVCIAHANIQELILNPAR
jgi:hypothetical protein